MFYTDCLINDKYLKQYSPIPLNYNTAEVANFVSVGEDLWIKPIIGIPLYEELLEEIKKGEISPANQTLLLEIYKLEGFAVCLEALPFIAYRFTETGVVKQKSDTTESIDTKELSYLQQTLRAQVEVRKEELIKWLHEYGSNYPNYYPDDCECGCSCGCGGDNKLKKPNPMTTIYSPKKKCTDLK